MDRGLMENTIQVVSKVCTDVISKCLLSVIYVAYSFSFDTLQGQGLIALMVLIIADFVTGIAVSLETGHKISSAKIFKTVVKIVIYYSMIALGHMTEYSVPVLNNFIDETVLAFLAITELISNLENFGKLGYAVPEKLLRALRKEKK